MQKWIFIRHSHDPLIWNSSDHILFYPGSLRKVLKKRKPTANINRIKYETVNYEAHVLVSTGGFIGKTKHITCTKIIIPQWYNLSYGDHFIKEIIALIATYLSIMASVVAVDHNIQVIQDMSNCPAFTYVKKVFHCIGVEIWIIRWEGWKFE